MPLIKDGRLVADSYAVVSDDDALPASGPVLVSLARFRADRASLLTRGTPLGLRLASNEPASAIAPDLPNLALVALEFPSFRDGRAYSSARLLRERYGFAGEIRAVGDVLRDQFLFMHRCGFNAFEVKDADAIDAWRKAMAEITVFYQAAADRRARATALRGIRRAAE